VQRVRSLRFTLRPFNLSPSNACVCGRYLSKKDLPIVNNENLRRSDFMKKMPVDVDEVRVFDFVLGVHFVVQGSHRWTVSVGTWCRVSRAKEANDKGPSETGHSSLLARVVPAVAIISNACLISCTIQSSVLQTT
jgi:hypothetical protein